MKSTIKLCLLKQQTLSIIIYHSLAIGLNKKFTAIYYLTKIYEDIADKN